MGEDFLTLVRRVAAERLNIPIDNVEVIMYINGLNNWGLLELLTEAAERE